MLKPPSDGFGDVTTPSDLDPPSPKFRLIQAESPLKVNLFLGVNELYCNANL